MATDDPSHWCLNFSIARPFDLFPRSPRFFEAGGIHRVLIAPAWTRPEVEQGSLAPRLLIQGVTEVDRVRLPQDHCEGSGP